MIDVIIDAKECFEELIKANMIDGRYSLIDKTKIDLVRQTLDKAYEIRDVEERIPLEDIERILDATYIYAILTNGFDIKIETTFEIEKVTSKGLWLKKNEYDMSFAPFKEYKKGWALTKEELL